MFYVIKQESTVSGIEYFFDVAYNEYDLLGRLQRRQSDPQIISLSYDEYLPETQLYIDEVTGTSWYESYSFHVLPEWHTLGYRITSGVNEESTFTEAYVNPNPEYPVVPDNTLPEPEQPPAGE